MKYSTFSAMSRNCSKLGTPFQTVLLKNRRVNSHIHNAGGSFFIYKRDCKVWRKDGHSYMGRKGNANAVREDQVKLKLDGVHFAICAYALGSDFGTPATFKRRAYWKIKDPNFVLVHYLDEHAYKVLPQLCHPVGSNTNGTSTCVPDPSASPKREKEEGQHVVQSPFSLEDDEYVSSCFSLRTLPQEKANEQSN